MKVSDLSKDRVDLVVDLGEGDEINLVYNPKAYTIAIEEEMESLGIGEGDDGEKRFKARALAVMLSPMLVEWDICQETPGDFPPTEDNIKHIPVEVLGKIVEKIGENSRTSSEEGKA
jgi:hypothetical protein